MTVTIDPDLQRKLVQYAEAAAPNEAVGVLWGDRHVPHLLRYMDTLHNVAPDPTKEFWILPSEFEEVLTMQGLCGRLAALWHSHPDTEPVPSLEDKRLMDQLRLYPMAIVGLTPKPVITLWVPNDNATRFYLGQRYAVTTKEVADVLR